MLHSFANCIRSPVATALMEFLNGCKVFKIEKEKSEAQRQYLHKVLLWPCYRLLPLPRDCFGRFLIGHTRQQSQRQHKIFKHFACI